MRPVLAFLLVAAASCSTGCSLIGLGVGAAVPRWEHDVSPEKIASYQDGTEPVRLDVKVAPEVAQTYSVPTATRAWYSGNKGLVVTVATPNGERAIPFRELEHVDVKVGSWWAQGLEAGLVFDLVALFVGIGVAALWNASPDSLFH